MMADIMGSLFKKTVAAFICVAVVNITLRRLKGSNLADESKRLGPTFRNE